MDFWTQVLDFARTTTHQVGDRLLHDFGQVQAQEKADGSLLTQADQWADEELRNAIASVARRVGLIRSSLTITKAAL